MSLKSGANLDGNTPPPDSQTPPPDDSSEKITDVLADLMWSDVVLAHSTVGSSIYSLLSNDGTFRIVFRESSDVGTQEIFKVPVNGSAPVKIKLPFKIAYPVSVSTSYFKISPDDKTLIFVSNANRTLPGWDLFSVNLETMAVGCLSCPSVSGSTITVPTFTPNGERVIFNGTLDNSALTELYSNNLAGTDRIKLNLPLTAPGSLSPIGYKISYDSNYIYYAGNHSAASPKHLYRVSPLGTGRIQVSSNPIGGSFGVSDFVISPNGTKIVYMQDQETIGVNEIYSANNDGTNTVNLNPSIIAAGDITSAFISPDGTRVIYGGDVEVDTKIEIYTVNLDGTGFAKLNPVMGADRDASVTQSLFTPNGDKVIFASDAVTNGYWDLYSVNIDGTGRTVLGFLRYLDASSSSTNPGVSFIDNQNLIYVSDNDGDLNNEIRRIRTDGTSAALLYSPGSGEIYTSWSYTADPISNSLVLGTRSSSTASNICKILRRNLDGTTPQTIYDCAVNGLELSSLIYHNGTQKIHGQTDDHRSVVLAYDGSNVRELSNSSTEFAQSFSITPDGNSIVSLKSSAASVTKKNLYIQSFGGGSQTQLNPGAGETVSQYYVSPDSAMVHALVQDSTLNYSIYKSNPNGTGWAKISGVNPIDSFDFVFQYIPSANLITYSADQDNPFHLELYGMGYDGSNRIRLHPNLADALELYKTSPLGNKVLYLADQDTNNVFELYTSNLDGSGNNKLNGVLPPGGDVYPSEFSFGFTPNGLKVFYAADQDTDEFRDAYSVNVDGTGRVKLTPTLSATKSVYSILPTPDSQKLVLHGSLETSGTNELFVVNTDGTGFQKISGPLVSGASIEHLYKQSFAVSPNSQRVVFSANKEDLQKTELFSVKIDGTSMAKLSPTMTHNKGNIKRFEITSDSDFIVYLANPTNANKYELFVSKSDGSSRIKLSRSMGDDDFVTNFQIVGNTVVFRLVRDDRAELYRIRLDGTHHERLHGDLTLGQNVGYYFTTTPDKSKLVFTLNASDLLKSNLYIVPF